MPRRKDRVEPADIQHHTLDHPVQDYDWELEHVPLRDVIGEFDPDWTPADWVAWLEDEVENSMRAIVGRDPADYYPDLEEIYLAMPEAMPVTLIYDRGKYYVNEGHHRVAMAHKEGLTKIPAWVGTLRKRRR